MKNKLFDKMRICLGIGYFCLIAPIIFSIYYSVPASDDFIYGSFVSSDNVVINALSYIRYLYHYGSCRWVVYFFQKCINPLNVYSLWHVHVGHLYGICTIIVFIVSIVFLFYSISFFAKILIDDLRIRNIATFLTIALLLSTYYYSEVYNWYTGATAYAIPLVLSLLLDVIIIRYFRLGESKINYILLFVIGIVPVTNEFLCVPVGIVYLYFYIESIRNKADGKNKIKNIIPLIYYILMGSTVVFAPGTFFRRNYYSINIPTWRLAVQAIINTLIRIKDIVIFHPLAVIILVLLFLIGIKTKGSKKHNLLGYSLVFLIGIIGAILPYCLGRGNTDTYMDVRMYYVLDYFLLISMALLIVMLGQNIALEYDIEIGKKDGFKLVFIMSLFAYLMLVPQNLYLKIPQVDIVKKSGIIRESYAFWDGILMEIENSKEDDVVIVRDKEPEWIPYFLWVGIEADNVYDQAFDSILPTDEIMVNSYYKKDSIVLHYIE